MDLWFHFTVGLVNDWVSLQSLCLFFFFLKYNPRWVCFFHHGDTFSGCGWRNSFHIYRAAASILNKRTREADKLWSSSFGGWAKCEKLIALKIYHVTKYFPRPRHWTDPLARFKQIFLRRGATGSLLRLRYLAFGFHKVRGISWQAEDLFTYQEGLSSIELVVCWLVGFCLFFFYFTFTGHQHVNPLQPTYHYIPAL
jgi:hypothetical protein